MGAQYTQTTVTPATTPSTSSTFDLTDFSALIREIVRTGVVEEPKIKVEMSSAHSFFNGNDIVGSRELMANLKFGQKIRVDIEKDQNPLSLYTVNDLEYTEVDSCHEQIELNCTMPCLNTKPEFQSLEFCFDKEYAYGVRACDKNKDFWSFEYFSKQYAKSKRGYEFGREVDLWNEIIDTLVATPATTVDVKIAAAHANHYWANLGTVAAAARTAVNEAYWYLTNTYDVNPTIFVTPEFATELVGSVENPYNLNLSQTRVNTYKQWDIPGFDISESVRTILGLNNVVVMRRSAWLTTGTTGSFVSRYPLWNDDATKQYVAILDPRVGYSFEKEGYHLDIVPYDCDKLVRGMEDTVYVGQGVTFSQYGMILEFDAYNYA